MKQVLSDGVDPAKVWTDEIDGTGLEQPRNLSQVPSMHKHVAAMSDVHAGYSRRVGSVIPTKATMIPAAVGVDTDCGILTQRLPLIAKVCLMTSQPCTFPLKPRSLTDLRCNRYLGGTRHTTNGPEPSSATGCITSPVLHRLDLGR
jgi:hypothetical protein